MPVDPQRLARELEKMKVLIRNDPTLRARFDRNGNGVIDGKEWDEVKKLVVLRLEREQAEAAATSRAVPGDPGHVAEAIVSQDLTPLPMPRPALALCDHSEMVLKRVDGIGQLYQSSPQLSYTLFSREETPLGAISHQGGHLLGAFSKPESGKPGARFEATDLLAKQTLVLQQVVVEGDVGFTIQVGGDEVAWVVQKRGAVGKQFDIGPQDGDATVHVRQRMLQPFTHDVQKADKRVGVLERRWAGLGSFLNRDNQIHVDLGDERLAQPIAWAMVAVMLQVDLQAAGG